MADTKRRCATCIHWFFTHVAKENESEKMTRQNIVRIGECSYRPRKVPESYSLGQVTENSGCTCPCWQEKEKKS